MTQPTNGYDGAQNPVWTGPAADAFSRASKVAAIHAFADWLADNPDVPMPAYLVANYSVDVDVEPDEYTRAAGVLAILLRHHALAIEGPRTVQGDIMITAFNTHGIAITYRAVAIKDDATRRRYVPET